MIMITQKQAKKLGRPNTIDMRRIHSIDYVNKTDKQCLKTTIQKWIMLFFMYIWWLFVGFLLFMMVIGKSEANYNLSIGDKIRLERIEVCQNAFDKWKETKNIPQFIRWKMPVISCALRMHWVYIQESGAGTSEMCINNKSCLWIKTKRNGIYWHNPFNSYREEREIFADKYFEFHFVKDPRTFIYGYLQEDGGYKWGWATWNKESYTLLLENIENNQNLIREYEYLYRFY